VLVCARDDRGFTVVSFHAHPDDEALLTGGTLARLAAEGHRVVLVVATSGEAGLTALARTAELGQRRLRELEASARALGVARVVPLGFADSGSSGARPPTAFSRVGVEEAAHAVADVLCEERADLLTSYDRHGGYGHPDHVHVHRVGRRAAQLAGTPVVLEATVDRELLQRGVRMLRRVLGPRHSAGLPDLGVAYTAHAELTHRIDVRRQVAAKRRALRAHASQAVGGSDVRTVALLLRMPPPLALRVLGHEWYVEVGRAPSPPLLDDVFATLRPTY